jgi:Holliday junction resolvase
MLESAIQSKIIKALEKAGWYVIKLIHTNKPGICDLECHRNGRTVYIEVKQPGEEATDLQLYRHKELRDHGIEVISEATSINDVKHLM